MTPENFRFWPRILLVGLLLSHLSCSDLSSYSTEGGECYVGEVVDADFLLKCFEPKTELKIALNVNDLAEGKPDAGRITTSDGQFEDVPFQQPPEVVRDSLSLFQFPGGREMNYLAYTYGDDPAFSPITVVISLMEDAKLEVRLIRHTREESEAGDVDCTQTGSNLFGLFRLEVDSECKFDS